MAEMDYSGYREAREAESIFAQAKKDALMEETVLIHSDDFWASTGSPTLGSVGARFRTWSLPDHLTDTTQVTGTYILPNSWEEYKVEAILSSSDSTGGNCVVYGVSSSRADGQDSNLGDVGSGDFTVSMPTLDVIKFVPVFPRLTQVPNSISHFRFGRRAGQAGDTYTGSLRLLGIKLTKIKKL